jgi:hypothetical protein
MRANNLAQRCKNSWTQKLWNPKLLDTKTLGGLMIRNEANARRLREANNAFKAIGNDKPMTDHAKAQQSLHENRERLKAERLAREAGAKDAQK